MALVEKKISVRKLIEYTHQEGSLGGGFSLSRALIGTTFHQKIQKKRGDDYSAEVPLSTKVVDDNLSIEVFGRADGIYREKNPVHIEEIKTTSKSYDILKNGQDALHWAQLKIYGYLYALEVLQWGENSENSQIVLSLLYVHIKTEEEFSFTESWTFKKLKEFFFSVFQLYADEIRERLSWNEKRDLSARKLDFPYAVFRKTQRDFSVAVYKNIRDGGVLYGRAPTGTGKSIAALFPAVKALSYGLTERIFYLTARTVGRISAEKCVNDMAQKGLRIRSISLTAKEKICLQDEVNCDPDFCPYSKDYYKKLSQVIAETKCMEHFDQANVSLLGKRYTVCPFELSLDISLRCDLIICDYNYAFDPLVYLKRFFDQSEESYTFLIDEAHNLPDRLRSSYSSELKKEDFLKVKRILREYAPDTAKKLQEVNHFLLTMWKSSGERGFHEEICVSEEFVKLIKRVANSIDRVLAKNISFSGKSEMLTLYFDILGFLKLRDMYTAGHSFVYEKKGRRGLSAKIVCHDPGFLFERFLKRAKSTVIFSATVIPFHYFKKVLTPDRDSSFISLPSPYDTGNLLVLIRSDIHTTFKKREESYPGIAEAIIETVSLKKGNYLVFFPSYSYLERVANELRLQGFQDFVCQEKSMSESERGDFIKAFSIKKGVTALAVSGGIFGEGIDLTGDKLIGVIVVGPGMPGVSMEINLIKEYFDNHGVSGFDYAYTYPGFNKVLQAGGRVIRGCDDTGIVLLIDERFDKEKYQRMFPAEWNNRVTVDSCVSMSLQLKSFWSNR